MTLSTAASNARIIQFIEEDLVEIRYFDDVTIKLEDVIEDFKVYDEFTKGKRVKKLVIAGKHSEMTAKARSYAQRENGMRSDRIIAEAIVIHSLGQRMVANFYFRIMRKKYPVRVFNNIAAARKWLSGIDNVPVQKQVSLAL